MVGDEPFARFLDGVLSALVGAGRIREGRQMSVADLLSEMAGPASPGLPSDFDTSSTPERRLVERIRAGGGTHILNRRERRTFSTQPPIAELREFAAGMIDADPDLPSSLGSVVASGAPDRRIAAVFFTLLHMPFLAEMVSRRLGLVYWLEAHAGLAAIVSSLRRTERRPFEVRQRRMRRDLRRSREKLASIVRHAVGATREFFFAHQLFIEKQLVALLEQRHDWRNQLTDVSVFAVDPPNPGEIALYRRWQELGQAVSEARASMTAQERTMEEIQARRRQAVQPERGRIYNNEVRPGRRILRSRRRAWRVLKQQRNDLRMPRTTRERVERYLAARRTGQRNAALARDRDEMLGALDTRLGLNAPNILMRPGDEERWRLYEDVLDELTREGDSDLNTHNFSFSFLAACRRTELERDIGMPRGDQADFNWITRPGHGHEAVDMNGPRRDIAIARPNRFVVPDRFTLPAGFARDPQHRETHLLGAEAPDERQDVFAKLATGLLGSRRARTRVLDDYFEDHGGDPIAPAELRNQTFSTRQLGLIILALFGSNLTAVNNLTALRARRAQLARRLEAGITAEVGVNASAELINRARANAGRAGRFSIATPLRGVSGVGPTQILAALRNILRGTAGQSGAGRLPLLDQLWRFLVDLHTAGAELRTGSGSVTLRHRYEFSGGQSLTVDVKYAHLFRIGRLRSASLVPGQFIGEVGTTGNAVNIHLHIEFQVRLDGELLGFCYPHEFFPIRPLPTP